LQKVVDLGRTAALSDRGNQAMGASQATLMASEVHLGDVSFALKFRVKKVA